jgi:major membrane immunogen (membrane-anchored lipoprotein)
VAKYTVSGTDTDAFGNSGRWTYALTVTSAGGAITQIAPNTGSVTTTGSAAFTDHLNTTGNDGRVTFTGGGTGLTVSSGGRITTTGTLAKGTYKATGTVADAFGDTGTFTYTLTVKKVTITQIAPTTGTVTTTGSAAFTDHLNTTGNISKRSFVKTGGGTGLTVSLGGRITTTGTLAKGTYKATGTVADAFGDTGIFTYTLTVTAAPISQTAPTGANSEAD